MVFWSKLEALASSTNSLMSESHSVLPFGTIAERARRRGAVTGTTARWQGWQRLPHAARARAAAKPKSCADGPCRQFWIRHFLRYRSRAISSANCPRYDLVQNSRPAKSIVRLFGSDFVYLTGVLFT